MELLKPMVRLFALSFCFVLTSEAQTFEQMQKAMKQSHSNEYRGDYAAAMADVQKVYKADSYEMNLRMGWLLYSQKKYPQSLEYYQKAIDLRKYSVEARLGYIGSANANKAYDKAYAKYEEILTIDPYNSAANYWVGVNYYKVKKYNVAAKYFELVVNMYPFDYDANHMLGWTYLSLGRMGEARHLFQVALMNKPDDASAKEGLLKCN